MKVVILAGGFGTRLSEYTESIPKPMVTVGGKPILWHIMNSYAKAGFNEFILALGFKADSIKQYFASLKLMDSDATIDFVEGATIYHSEETCDWKVTMVDTGLESMTGGRLGRLRNYLADEPFMLTYGDGLSDVPLQDLLDFHQAHGKKATITAVRPVARFGELRLEGTIVTCFREKPQVTQSWINGGFFVFQPEVLDLISGDETVLEKDPLEQLAKEGELMAYKHEGFWQCMDTKRDRDFLEELWGSGQAAWPT
jgi:glucose-1-phosphate cytidylyltransferase